MTDEVKVLSDDELFALEVRPSRFRRLENRHEVGLTLDERDALCATVRALRQVNKRLSTGLMNIHHVITNGPCERAVALGMATSAVSSLLSQNTALREQLAHAIGALKDARRIVGAREIGADTEAWIDDIIRKSEQP